MTKYFGRIGFLETVETEDGLYKPVEVVRRYYGDVTRNFRRNEDVSKINTDLNLSNQFSIIADKYAHENFSHMAWIEFKSVKWKITSVEVSYPRLILEVSGVYNGQ